jgi:hypothetical protein
MDARRLRAAADERHLRVHEYRAVGTAGVPRAPATSPLVANCETGTVAEDPTLASTVAEPC